MIGGRRTYLAVMCGRRRSPSTRLTAAELRDEPASDPRY